MISPQILRVVLPFEELVRRRMAQTPSVLLLDGVARDRVVWERCDTPYESRAIYVMNRETFARSRNEAYSRSGRPDAFKDMAVEVFGGQSYSGVISLPVKLDPLPKISNPDAEPPTNPDVYNWRIRL